jgi:hypothetical protein
MTFTSKGIRRWMHNGIFWMLFHWRKVGRRGGAPSNDWNVRGL